MTGPFNGTRAYVLRAVACAVLIPAGFLRAQAPASPAAAAPLPSSPAFVDYLIGLRLAEDQSKPEALHRLAESLRLQPANNPAASLVFELLTQQRSNSRLIFHGHTGDILFAAYSPDGSRIVSTSSDHTARIWNARTGTEITPALQHDDAVLTAAFSADGKRLVTGTSEDTVRVWDAMTGKPIGPPITINGAVQSVTFSPDGKLVAAGTDDGKLRTFDSVTGAPVSRLVVYHEAVNQVRFSHDGTRLLAATADGFADLLNPRTGDRLMAPLRQRNIVFTADWNAAGTSILTSSADHTATIWNATTGQSLGHFDHGASVDAAMFNADGSRILTISWDHTARVWNTATGAPVTPPLQHSEAILEAGFSADSTVVATASRDRTTRIWDAATGQQLHTSIRSGSGSAFLVFPPKGRSLLITAGSSLTVVDLAPDQPAPTWLADLAEFAAAQVKYDQRQSPDLVQARTLHTALMSSHAQDDWTRFGQWYFTESEARAISPWSTLTLEDYVNLRIAQGDRESLEEASRLSVDHPAWQARIIPKLEAISKPQVASATRLP